MSTKSRRRFVLQAAATAGFPFISTSVTRAQAQRSRRKIGFALCGLGGLSENQIAPALFKSGHCRLTGIVTGSPDKVGKWKARYGIPDHGVYTYDTIGKMADNPDIDVVYIVTPNAQHCDQTVAAAQAGKHVFCEKPMEVSVEKCQRMIDACRAAKRLLGVAYRCQYDPNHLECIRLARSKQFGATRIIDVGFGFPIGNGDLWRLKHALSGGGALVDLGIYALQATRYLSGEEPIEVSAMEAKTDPKRFAEVDESMTWQSRFPSGALATCSASYNVGGINFLRVTGERGWFGLDPAFGYSGNRGRRSDGVEIALPGPDLFGAEMDDFARCILDGTPSKVSGEEGMRDVRIMAAIYQSARSGRAVKFA
ncbi:MAG TPA: Gfo/Idh/MocA family oxidoreductase [Steroidobacteraceae bacterium]